MLLNVLYLVAAMVALPWVAWRRLTGARPVAAPWTRFTGAIASIMLVPTFIVGLYGQNFVNLPETSWEHGYIFSWGIIVLVTVGQVWYFRRRRWI